MLPSQKNEAMVGRFLQFSKRLVFVDIIVYSILMVACLTILVLWPDLAEYCVSVIGYVTTAYIALRGAYSVKAALENVKKIQNNINSNYSMVDDSSKNG